MHFRNYDPEAARWMSADPAGFPDGPNNHFYAAVPTIGVDPLGLQTTYDPADDLILVASVVVGWERIGFNMSARRANHSFNNGGNANAPQSEIDALQTAGQFTSVFNDSFFQSVYDDVGLASNYNLERPDGTNVNYYGGLLPSDLGWAYGNLTYAVSGSFSWVTRNGKQGWETTASFTVSDTYDFDADSRNPAIQAFDRLQANGVASIYDTAVSFNLVFNEF